MSRKRSEHGTLFGSDVLAGRFRSSEEKRGIKKDLKSRGTKQKTDKLDFVKKKKKNKRWEFPGDPMVENPPADTGDMGLIPGSGKFHRLQGN